MLRRKERKNFKEQLLLDNWGQEILTRNLYGCHPALFDCNI